MPGKGFTVRIFKIKPHIATLFIVPAFPSPKAMLFISRKMKEAVESLLAHL
jgi:hypothetical protein